MYWTTSDQLLIIAALDRWQGWWNGSHRHTKPLTGGEATINTTDLDVCTSGDQKIITAELFCKPTWNVHHRWIILRPCCYHTVFPARWHSKLSVLASIIASCELSLITMAITIDIPPPRAKTSDDRGLQTSGHGGVGPLIPSCLHPYGQHPNLLY
jgi:hypothetical protein